MIALGALLASGWTARAAPPPLELYGKLPSIEQATLSPSGKLVAYVLTDGEKRTVGVESFPDRKPVFIGNAGAAKVRDLAWAGDQHLILTTSTTKQAMGVVGPRVENMLASDIDLSTFKVRPLMENFQRVNEPMNIVLGVPDARMVDGKPVAFARGFYFDAGEGRVGLFRIDLERHVAKLIEPGAPHGASADWIIDPQGKPVVQESYNYDTGAYLLQIKAANGLWRKAQSFAETIDPPNLMGFSRDGKSVLVNVNDDTLGSGWRELSPETGSWGDLMKSTDGESAIDERTTGKLIGTRELVGDTLAYTFFDPHDAAVWRAVNKAYPGDLVSLVSWSDDRKRILVRVDSAELGPAYALVDLTTGQATWLGPEYAGLKSEDVSPVRPVRYKAADGLEITGYLTVPHGRQAHNLPLVVLPHGGPHARDTPGFDWWAQALASRGYAVLQVNYRGSSGLGADFFAAGFGEFGRKMQTDLSDGVRHLVQDGLVDPKRVCIVGGSYGGYAALAGATLDRGVYRCAVSYAGVSDLRSDLKDSISKEGESAGRFWLRYVGAKNIDDPLLDQRSPAAHAGDVDIPILLIHGRDDTIVTISQSRRMADALRKAGKPVELIELSSEDHWLSRGETRLQMLKATVAFLEKNNPPD
jgi:dipeptidyl aminopeptidase/acylaminoacyl peptidase